MLQSMQRAPCSREVASGTGRYTSRQSFRRTGIGRALALARSSSRNPVILPMRHPDQFLEFRLTRLGAGPRLGLEHPLVVAGHDLDERGDRRRPVDQQPLATCTARELHVTLDQAAYERDLLLVVEILEVDQGAIAPRAEL